MLAFLVPLIIRAVPEVLMGAYVTGFDTMGHYVPNTLLWLNGSLNFWRFLGTAPLFYTIIYGLASTGITLTAVLKVIPPVLHGFLGLSVYGYAKKGLDWSSGKSMITALLATIYFVSLRVSWDMLRNELALIVFFVVLLLMSKVSFLGSWKRYFLLSLAMVLVVLAHQLVSVIMFGVIALTVLYNFFREKHSVAKLVLVALPSVALFLVMLFITPEVSDFRLIFGFSQSDGWLSLFGYSSYATMLISVVGFFLFCFLPILPFIIIGFKRLGNVQLRAWVLLGVIAALIPLVSPSNLRWLMMLTYPFAFFVTDALSRIRLASWKRFRITLNKIASVYLVLTVSILAFGLISYTPEKPMPYFDTRFFNGYAYQVPTSMLQNTVSIADCQDTEDALQWLNSTMGDNSVLLSHRAFYGWSLLALNRDRVILYEYNNPEDTAKIVNQEGDSRIYLIWWVNGQGWYGQSTVSPSFKEIHRNGRIAIYSFEPT